MADRIQVDARCSGNLPQHAQQLRHFLRACRRWQRKSLLRLQAKFAALLQCVGGHKHLCVAYWCPECSRGRAEKRDGGVEIHIVDLQAYLTRDHVRVEQHLHAERLRHLLVCGACLAMQIEAAPPWLRSEEHTSELQSPCNLVCRL